MKKLLILAVGLMLSLPLMAQNKYVGVRGCVCHNTPKQGKQIDAWKKTKHAEAYNTLRSVAAKKYADEKGLTVAATEAKECLECHSTGYGGQFEKNFNVADGVQCESCHGAASGYLRIHNKPENREKALAAGMIVKTDEKFCKTCHNSKSHPVPEFDFKKAMEKIAHPVPKS